MTDSPPLGHHIILDLHGCQCHENNLKKLSSGNQLMDLLEESVNPLARTGHQFKPYGYTLLTVLEESHISIHTWPERHHVAMDLYTCTGSFPDALIDFIMQFFQPTKVVRCDVERGSLDPKMRYNDWTNHA